MTGTHTNKTPNNYDTSINVIGGLRDISAIYKAIDVFFREGDSLDDLVSDRNELTLRTERSRIRVKNAIKTSFLQFRSQDHLDIIRSFFMRDDLPPERDLLLFWQYALSNRLFREISSQVFMKAYYSGRAGLDKNDIIAYLKEFLNQNPQLDLKWSENTIHTLATKYLNLMTKLQFLEGARLKTFRHIRLSGDALVLFLYFARLYDPENTNILKNEMLPLAFVAPEDLQGRLKKLSLKDYFNMNFNGVELNIELTHGYKGICDVLYHRS
jgi:hypothetical protein